MDLVSLPPIVHHCGEEKKKGGGGGGRERRPSSLNSTLLGDFFNLSYIGSIKFVGSVPMPLCVPKT